MGLDHLDHDSVAERDTEYELAQEQATQAQALARTERARHEQATAAAVGYDQTCEESSLTR